MTADVGGGGGDLSTFLQGGEERVMRKESFQYWNQKKEEGILKVC